MTKNNFCGKLIHLKLRYLHTSRNVLSYVFTIHLGLKGEHILHLFLRIFAVLTIGLLTAPAAEAYCLLVLVLVIDILCTLDHLKCEKVQKHVVLIETTGKKLKLI